MITLGGITISDNMYLSGDVESGGVVHQQKRTIEGVSSILISQKIGGRAFTLGSDMAGGSVMGIWCKSLIDSIKALELAGLPQQLNYRGTIYSVYIVDTSGFTPLFKWQEESATKAYTGQLTLIEV
jgi:hypothetical protein